ncbi:hypothetical protein ACEV8G_01275 [Vibrio parahaemolyticus]|nr:hypothetical protein [Vibrio parahaemolyticus]HCH1486030.1 hypothetical protein [Vibrio parahaemolyticus]
MYLEDEVDLPDDITVIVLLDDVYTSGAQMNSVASILLELEMIPDNVPIYGFTFGKTTSPNPFANIQSIINQLNAAENEQ